MAVEMPSGTVTFLFTDVEGSTVAWEERPEEMRAALARHDEIVREGVGTHGGYVFATAGDSFAVSFARADEAVTAAVEMQRRLSAEVWPAGVDLRVRMGLHTGEAFERDGDYFGSAVNRAARLMSAAHGGQVVVSESTRGVVGDIVGLVDVGVHRLKDLSAPQRVFQVVAEGLEPSFPPLETMDVVRHNLPIVADELLGRDDVVDAVRSLLGSRSLVTLVGVGGIGKTRLSLQVAADLVGEFVDGVWFCELAPVGEPEAVANAVAQAIGIRQHAGRSMVDSVAEFCRRRRMLVVLDNCEHVLDGAAELVEAVLRAAPDVRVLSSSREAMGIAGEQIVPIGSLAVEDEDSPGVELFVEHVAAVRPGGDWSVEDWGVARSICDRLDGVPLAIELAASRARSMTLVDIESHLDEAFRLLRGGRRGVERHRTLQAAIDWSYQPLDDAAKRLFERLAVFSGGWDLEAAEAVCADGEIVDALDVVVLLDELVAKSLVAADTSRTHARYRLLEPLRQYAEDRLAQRGEAELIRDRAGDYYTAWAERWFDRLFTDELGWQEDIRVEWGNLRVAFDWTIADRDVDLAVRLVCALHPALSFLIEHEVGEWAQRTLDLDGVDDHPDGPRVAGIAAGSAWWLGDLHRMERNVTRAEATAHYRPDQVFVTQQRALAVRNAGDIVGELELAKRCVPVDVFERLNHYSFLGIETAGPSPYQDLDLAEQCAAKLYEDADATGSRIIRSRACHVDGMIRGARNEHQAAAELYRESIDLARQSRFLFGSHLPAVTLAFAIVSTGDLRPDDLRYFASTLREQVDAGQRTDLWLTLAGALQVFGTNGRLDLAAEILGGLKTSPWCNLPFVALLENFVGRDGATVGETRPDLDDIVDKTLVALDELAETTPDSI